jgi:hypothetical protein
MRCPQWMGQNGNPARCVMARLDFSSSISQAWRAISRRADASRDVVMAAMMRAKTPGFAGATPADATLALRPAKAVPNVFAVLM